MIRWHRGIAHCLLMALATVVGGSQTAAAQTTDALAAQVTQNLRAFGFSRVQKRAYQSQGLYPSSTTDSCPNGDQVPYTNPTVPPGTTQPPGASTDQVTVPEGLSLSGVLCLSRPTAIYVHGWTEDGSAEDFIAPDDWAAAGYNTFIFRWHRDAYDPNSPDPPEQRIWNSAGAKFVTAYMSLLSTLGTSYSQPIRVVGHSLGTQMATYLAYQLTIEGTPQRPIRVEYLDPYIGIGSALPADTQLTGPPGSGVALHSVVLAMVDVLSAARTALLNYSSITCRLFVPALRTTLPTQQMGLAWVPGPTAIEHLVNLHNNMRPYYFTGISEARPTTAGPGPLYAFSALTSTEEIFARPRVKYLQIQGLATIDVGDDVYTRVQDYPIEGVRATAPNF